MHKIEQELGTEIQPIPKVIDKALYVAEFQMVETEDDEATIERKRAELTKLQKPATTSANKTTFKDKPLPNVQRVK